MVDMMEKQLGGRRGSSGVWPFIGLAVAALAFIGMMIPSAGFSVGDDIPVETMVAKFEEARGSLYLGGALQSFAAMGLVVFGACLHRVLRDREPAGSITPVVALGGSLLTAAMVAMAAAHTQLAGGMEEGVDPPILLTLHTLEENLYAGAWCALALAAGAVAVSALRRGTFPRWLGGVSAFAAVLLLVAQLVVPWAGWFPALLWVAVSSFALRNLSLNR